MEIDKMIQIQSCVYYAENKQLVFLIKVIYIGFLGLKKDFPLSDSHRDLLF
jgi:hypothetical protein